MIRGAGAWRGLKTMYLDNIKEKWVQKAVRADFTALGQRLGVDPVIVRLAVNRGLRDEESMKKYFYGSLDDLYDGRTMKDLMCGCELLATQIREKKLICIASDYDVDGVYSGYILWRGIKDCGGEAYITCPDRISEGYGLNERIIREAYDKGAKCIITCDNGIAALEEIKLAKSLGMTVIVTDHHQPVFFMDGDKKVYQLPQADAVIDPHQPDCAYPFKGLCGAGVAYKVIEQLYELMQLKDAEIETLLPFAAIATVADVMDLVDENRIIVKNGLRGLAYTQNEGLKAIMTATACDPDHVSAYQIGFVIGPCFNAAGRLKSAMQAVRLLQTESASEARMIAEELVTLNESRKEMTEQGIDQALEIIEREKLYEDAVLVIALKGIHESVVGIVAGRLKEKFHRPVIVGTYTREGIKASGRSIEAYNMYEKLNACRSMFLKFGGHAMAAGLTFRAELLEEIRQRLNDECGLTDADLVHKVQIDVAMPVGYITEKLIDSLELLEPFGKGNEKPVFAEAHFQIISARIIGKNKDSLKLRLMNRTGSKMDALLFNEREIIESYIMRYFGVSELDKMYRGRENAIDLGMTYYPQVNEFRGEKSLQIVISGYQKF